MTSTSRFTRIRPGLAHDHTLRLRTRTRTSEVGAVACRSYMACSAAAPLGDVFAMPLALCPHACRGLREAFKKMGSRLDVRVESITATHDWVSFYNAYIDKELQNFKKFMSFIIASGHEGVFMIYKEWGIDEQAYPLEGPGIEVLTSYPGPGDAPGVCERKVGSHHCMITLERNY